MHLWGIYKPLRRVCIGTNLWRETSAAYFVPYFTGRPRFSDLVLVYFNRSHLIVKQTQKLEATLKSNDLNLAQSIFCWF